MYTALLLLASSLLVNAGIQQKDFTGIGNIFVWKSEDWRTATPKQKVGCLTDQGKFIAHSDESKHNDCGVFSRLADYPWTLSSKHGNCTFEDQTQPRNTDSKYGQSDYAWNCVNDYKAEIYDELYTIDGFTYVFLCFGDIACYYDAKKVPNNGEVLSLWQYRWGSEQMGITPGHVKLQLLWHKLGDLPKREGEAVVPGPRMRIDDGSQVPLQGSRARR